MLLKPWFFCLPNTTNGSACVLRSNAFSCLDRAIIKFNTFQPNKTTTFLKTTISVQIHQNLFTFSDYGNIFRIERVEAFSPFSLLGSKVSNFQIQKYIFSLIFYTGIISLTASQILGNAFLVVRPPVLFQRSKSLVVLIFAGSLENILHPRIESVVTNPMKIKHKISNSRTLAHQKSRMVILLLTNSC